ncbi:leucine-rich repeat protein, partial [Verrucomicrobia bacterium]|nr:leucine-rich repeat protein [Verrucomicrobiota bacterium]
MHKKLWPLLVCLLSIWFTVNLSAASLEDLSYRLIGEEIQITKCNTAASGTLDIPATVEGKPVTSIGGEAFAFCRVLESITIPDGVTTIGTDAFYDCDRLKSINVHPDNSHFSSLSGVLYNKNKTILRVVPEGYTGLLEVPESVNLIALYALQGCRNITEIIFTPLQAPALDEKDEDPFWALGGKTARVLSNAQGYDAVGYKSLDIKIFDKKNEILIYPGSNMPGADFSNMDLREVDFTGVSFPRANFSGSNLEGAKFSNAFLEDSNFSNAKLNNAILLGANLVGTNLDQSDLVGANLIGIVTGGHIGTPINIPTEFRMLNGNLIGPGVQIYTSDSKKGLSTDFSNADLSGMDLSGSYFDLPNFSGANLSRVNFTKSWVYRADFSGANLTGIILKDAVCYTPEFENTTFTGADFSGAKVYAHRNEGGGATNFSEADLSGVDFTGALLFSGNFSGANLSGAHLSKAKLGRTPNIDNASIKMAGGANFQGANLSNTDLSGADLENIISADIEGFPAALPDGFRLINGYIIGPKVRLPSSADLSGGNLAGLNFEGASMPNVNFSGANLAGTKLAGANIGWASPTELLPIVGEPESLPMHWQLRDGYLFDSRAPKVTLIGSREVIHKVGLEYLDPGATAIDNEGNSLEIETRGTVDSMGLKLGVYGIRYTASDAVGNVGSAYRIVRVMDLTPPVITLNGKALLHVMLGTTYQDAGASAIDNVDGALAVTTSGIVDPNTLGTYTLTYKASDQAGNVVSDHREIKVINSAIANGLNNLQFRDNGSRAIVTGCTRTARGAIEIPSTYNGKPVTSIKERAFHLCKSLTSITIPNSVEFIGESTFEGCESLSSVIIGNSVTSIAEKAFMNCSELTSVTIPDSVTSIGNNAFQYCSELKSAAIGSSVTSIGDYSFANCSGLTSVNIGKSINSIGRFAFSKCLKIINFTVPDSVTFIGNSAFENCRSLTSVTIPDKVASIEKKTFSYCISLESVTISDNVTSIAYAAFRNCHRLTSVTIPDGVTIIEIDAFSRCESLTSAGIGSSVTSIGNGAFSNCKSLTSVTIGKSVKVIGESAFKRCKKLQNVIIPDSVYSIRSYAFQYCGSLRSVTFEGNAPKTLGKGVFSRTRRDAKAYVKANATGF